MPTDDLSAIAQFLEEQYNDAMSVYTYDDRVRLTNGSAAHYVDIYVNNGQSLALEGDRYGETIATSCDAAFDALKDTLSQLI